MPTFLEDFIALTENTEIPQSFALWSGISTVSAALGRRVYMDMGVFTVYPNLYIVLVAGSGRCRKSTAIKASERLLREVEPGPNIVAQKVTPEALIEALKVTEAVTEEGKTSKVLREVCEGHVVADELATFLNKKSYEAGLATLLIPLYDCVDRFEYRTRGHGVEVIQQACLGMLGASTPDWLRDAVPKEAIGGGLTSRMVFVFEDDDPAPVAIPVFTEKEREAMERLIKTLEHLQGFEGEMKLTSQAVEVFTEMYNTTMRSSPLYDNKFLNGYASRRHVHLLKISMCLAVSTTFEQEVKAHHLEAADDMLLAAEAFMPKVMDLVTATEKGDVTERVYRMIAKRGSITRTQLMRLVSHQINSQELQEVVVTLEQAGMIEVVSDTRVTVYKALD